MEKSPDAFRTISEVADWLDVPTHVLRFWESRFKQIKPVKRAGGRRYYRPSDMALIGGIKVLLHDEGMTIRGAQKLLREKGIKHVAGYAPGLTDDEGHVVIEGDALPIIETEPEPEPTPEVIAAEVETASAPVADAGDDVAQEPEKVDFLADEDTEEDDAQLDLLADADPEDDAPEAPDDTAPITLPDLDIPATDPEDDDADHDAGNGAAFLLRTTNPARLATRKAELATLRDRAAALRDRLQGA